MNENELNKALKEAWNLENSSAHGVDDPDVEEIGIVDKGERRYILLKDTSGRYWYQMMIRVDGIYVSEEEAVFGRKIKKQMRRR